ncbi:MAG: YHS domain-containing protein [Chthonomonadales bacterium]|nr:YHS domain-containing protein [Chthonomonadales bacterium]
MSRFAPALACLALLAAIAVAGPNADKTKKAAANGNCPHATAQCADCPDAAAKCADCPDAAAKCPGMTKAAKAEGNLATMKCGEGTKQINIAKLTAEKKYADYKGKRYYFACSSCPTAFKKDPAGYAARHTGFPIPRTTKKAAAK